MLPKPGHVAHAYPSSTNIEIRGEGWGGKGAILVLVLDFGIELGFDSGLAFCFWFSNGTLRRGRKSCFKNSVLGSVGKPGTGREGGKTK